jgi:hypothetical protein
MCIINIDKTDDLWKSYKTLLKSVKRRYNEAVREQFDKALEPLGYEQIRYDHSTGSSSVTYQRSNGTQLIINYLGEGFIYGDIYPVGCKKKDGIPVGIWQKDGKRDPHSIEDFVKVLIEKEKEISL